MAWAFDDEEPEIWTPGDAVVPDNGTVWCDGEYRAGAGLPDRINRHILAGGEIRAWNAAFERIIWDNIMVPRYGAPEVKLEQWVCAAAEAAAMALPRSLDQCSQVTAVAQQKAFGGYELMMRMTRPRSFKDGRPIWWDVEDRKQRLYEYCKQDVRTERALTKVLRRLTPTEREVYLLTERMNDRGVAIDIPLITAAKAIATEGIERANAALCEVTGGALTTVTQTGKMREWLNGQGIDADSISKAAVRDLLESDLAPEVRTVLELRAEAGRSSIAKLDSLLACACHDGRIRGMLLYHGASTGRWSGRLAQLHNFPRGEVDRIEGYISAVLAYRYDAIDLLASPISVVSSMLRSMVTASEGYDLLAADYSAIEARVLNWIAGQSDILDLFARGEDVYKYNAARLYNIPLAEVQKFPHRQTGKFQELGCGFGMGWKKAISAAKAVYGLELDEKQARDIVDSYRDTHDRVVSFWYKAEACAMQAVAKAGEIVEWGGSDATLRFLQKGAYLYLILPSRRPLCYASPRIVERETPWGEIKPCVEISALNGVTRKWERQAMYGGLWTENIVQAIARDIMAEGKLRAERAGYPPLLSVHDEVICERPVGEGSLDEFQSLLAACPEWAAGCPIATEGWRGFRYRK